MSRLFISHCTEDKEQIESFVDFLMLGMGIARSDIFCTLQKGTLPSGAQFMEKIKEALIGCEKVVCFITPHYLRSVSCLVEMGAAWAQTGKIIPLLADSLRYDDLNHTPLQGLQMLCDHSTEDLTVLFEELRTIGIATNERLVEFNRQLTKYLHSRPSKQLLQRDTDGGRAQIGGTSQFELRDAVFVHQMEQDMAVAFIEPRLIRQPAQFIMKYF